MYEHCERNNCYNGAKPALKVGGVVQIKGDQKNRSE